jgi:hypothetical protein
MSSSTLAARQAVELGAERVENPCVAGVFAQIVVARGRRAYWSAHIQLGGLIEFARSTSV